MELLDVLDEDGRVIGQAPRDDVHAQGLLHRCVHVFVFTPRGELWLQQRALDRHLWPGLWTSSASGHVDAGEREEQAAAREAREELGLDLQPRRVGEFRFHDAHENELAGLWEARTAEAPRTSPEVMALKAVDRRELAALRQHQPASFAPSFAAALRAYGW